jgi:hypothetical protein
VSSTRRLNPFFFIKQRHSGRKKPRSGVKTPHYPIRTISFLYQITRPEKEAHDMSQKTGWRPETRDPIEFDFGDSWKTARFAAQVENEGRKGNNGTAASMPPKINEWCFEFYPFITV